jgi:hypothetical protein
VRRPGLLAAAVVALVAATVVAFPVAAHAAPRVSSPIVTQQEVEADRPVPVPEGTPCTEQIVDHDFGNSYYAPAIGTYAPPAACPGPWNTVVLTLTSSVVGEQFDRLLDVTVGGAELLHGSTSEPCCTGSNAVTWTVQRDVTQYSSLFESSQPVLMQLDNVTDSTYTGIYDVQVSLSFYEASVTAPARDVPDEVLPITQVAGELASPQTANEPEYSVSAAGQQVGQSVTFPRNLDRLTAELFADGHGPCEEFFYEDPSNCAGSPYREVAIYIDGALAGAAPVYPVAFTGLDGPGLWEPVPSPRAWDLRPYDVDLTPFVGELTDGQPHKITLGVLDATYTSGDYWPVAANLLAYEQHDTAVTTGALTSSSAPAAPTDTVSTDAGGTDAAYRDVASHVLTFTGYVNSPTGPVTTTVTSTNGETSTQGATVADDASWTWDETSATTAGGNTTTDDDDLAYSALVAGPATFTFGDSGTDTDSTDGSETAQSTFTETMTTADATGLAYNGAETEKFGYADTAGACYDRTLGSQAGELTVDTTDALCPTVTAVGPPTSVPEAPMPELLLGAGVVALGGVALGRRRRRVRAR